MLSSWEMSEYPRRSDPDWIHLLFRPFLLVSLQPCMRLSPFMLPVQGITCIVWVSSLLPSSPGSLILCLKSMHTNHKIQELPENSNQTVSLYVWLSKVSLTQKQAKSPWFMWVHTFLICCVLIYNIHLLKTYPAPCLELYYTFFHLIAIQSRVSS